MTPAIVGPAVRNTPMPADAESEAVPEPARSGTAGAGDAVRSKPWLATRLIARLQSFKHDVDLIVAEGMTQDILALGPGHVAASALPGNAGNSIIGAHGATYFRFLERMAVGDRILIERNDNREFWFRVTSVKLADSRVARLQANTEDCLLSLVTCHPFDTISSGCPLRYVITAQKIPVTCGSGFSRDSSASRLEDRG